MISPPLRRVAAGSPLEDSDGFNVLDYGARNDASASSSEAFRAAIQSAKAAGGGTEFTSRLPPRVRWPSSNSRSTRMPAAPAVCR